MWSRSAPGHKTASCQDVGVSLPRRLPELDGHHPLDHDTISAFQTDGHCCVRGLATAIECADYLPEIEAGVEAWYPDPPPMGERSTYQKAFLQALALRGQREGIRRFVDSPRFARVAADLLGVDGVRLYHDQALFKEPTGGRTPWHQDQTYWPLDTDDTITMWMPLADIHANVGSMTFVDGSHRGGDIEAGDISDESDARIEARIEAEGLSTTTHGSLRAGDATFHRGWTLHSAPPNPTPHVRPVMTIIYFADGARIIEPRRDEQRFDLRMWLGDGAPGSLADGPSNPLLWPTG